MYTKNRKFSLDSSVYADGGGLLGLKKGPNRFHVKKSKHSHSMDDAQLEIQELNHSHSPTESLREHSIAEENLDQPEGPIHVHTLLKHNKTFHRLFQEIPERETLAHAFTCALQKEVPYHGKLFVSESHVCFYSSVLLKDTKVVIPIPSVKEVKKHNPLSMLTIHTADGEKYSFVSLRHRDVCYKLLQSICSHILGESANSSPHVSSAENEGDRDMPSSYSSLEDCMDHDHSGQDSIYPGDGFPEMSSEGPTRSNSTRQSSLTDEDNRAAVRWIWRIFERVTSLFFFREMRNISILFYIYVMLMVLLLLTSGYIGLRIIALEEQLNSLGAMTELSSYPREYQEM